MLRSLAEQFERPLVICATEASAAAFGSGSGATTFWGLAADVLTRHASPVRILSTEEILQRFDDDDLAAAVCHYEASFLGLEELRTHAAAAGAAEQWEAVAQQAERNAVAMRDTGEATWASVLVQASLLLRDESVLEAERSRFDAVLVDDFEAASFATNRLLTQLAGFGGPVVVAGNPDNAVWRHVAGTPAYLSRFPRRFGAVEDVHLEAMHGVGGGVGHVELLIAPGGDPWLPLPDGPVPVALASSLSWSTVSTVVGGEPAESAYDIEILGGPDVPSDEERAARRGREDEARWALARSRGGVA